jgi:hypothetical protein
MRKILIFLCLSIALSPGFAQSCKSFVFRHNTSPVKDKICSEALIEDLKELKERLYEIHPDLFRYTSTRALDSAFISAIKRCGTERTLLEFSQILNDYLLEIRDSHTFFNLRELLVYERRKRHYFPFGLTEMNNKFVITKSWKTLIPVGAELLSFNDHVPRKNIISALCFSPIEGYSDTAQKELSTHVLSGILNLQSPTKMARVSYAFNGDTIIKEVKRPRLRNVLNSPEFLGDDTRITYQRYNQKAVLTITSFSPTSIASFKKRLDEIFKKIKADSIESLAIDLRNNTGGYILLQEYLMSFISPKGTTYPNYYVYKRSDYDRFEQLSTIQKWRFKKTAKRYYPNGAIAQEWDFYNSPKGSIDTVLNEPTLSNRFNIQFKGKCSLFINGMSMSASANFAAWFALSNRGGIIGTPATGTYTGTFANPVTIYLNNTALPIMISTMKVNSQQDPSSNKPILPTVLLTPTAVDIQEGKDIHLSYFLSH